MADTLSQGCSLKMGSLASPANYETIASITSYQGPSGSRTVIDATTLASTAKEKAVGLPDYGQVTFDFKFQASDTILVDVWDNFVAGTSRTFQMAFSDSPATTFSFSAFVLNFSLSTAVDDLVRGSVTLEINGAVTDNLA